MTQTAAITEAITTLQDAENRFNFVRVEDEKFFPEWYEGLSEITEAEKASVDVVRRRYLYHRAGGDLLEGTVILLLVSSILALSGFYDPPFRIKAESSVELVLDDGEEILRGRIDVLVLQEQLWVMVLESKKTTLSVWSAVPQALAYMMANPNPSKPVFGMVTNGDDILFVKVTQTDTPQYDLSRVFAPFASARELYAVLQATFHRPVMLAGVADCERATPGDNIVIPPSIMPAAKAAGVLRFADINFHSRIFFSVGLVWHNESTNLFMDSGQYIYCFSVSYTLSSTQLFIFKFIYK
ncbi:putative type IV restriction endonuclease [Nostoc flagelliforme CCNUN1]|uniref:Putative type IV restriction endonuclease n=1 Tax=Nostoc flagelliforme CCNUN1 TaxID=2038116 RepID=A0A2K8SQG0_9NOSO|nr:putative type IV restriction endonuclease [Nostoc flagelliforme CCNUN1]